ncbi:hypothetical protein DID88_006694 [Monilinia fructigena]|uniref:Uncharacterized protein n=1 Tax=Monilinia fructigena TaxID=38457 RepID=A0A395II66_9HELO|nr:hypothetical protein DID88_006694 [Monilinia fructigena]
MPPRRDIEYSCGHTTPEPDRMETQQEILKRSLTRAFSFGLKGQSLAQRTRTIQPSRPQRMKSGLKRVLSLGMASLSILKSVEVCPSCRPPEPFTSDEYVGWVDEQPERDEVFGLHIPEGDRILTERDRILAEEDRILTEEIQSQLELAPHEYGSSPAEGQDANVQDTDATQHRGSSSGQAPKESKVASPSHKGFSIELIDF